MDTHGHQTSGQAEQQDRLLSDLGNDGARQGEHIMAAITVSIALFATSAPASTEVGFMVASPFFKILYVIACFWGLALQLVVMGDSGNCAGFILIVDDKGTIVWCLLIVSG